MVKVLYKKLSQIEWEDSEHLYRAEIICDDVNELPQPDHYGSWTIDMGSIAYVINTGDTYRLNSSGDWKLQKKTEDEGMTFTEEDKAKLNSLTNPILLKGRVDSYEDLQDIENPKTGWLYFVGSKGADAFKEYVYTESDKWEFIGFNSIDLSNYVQKTDYATADTGGVVKIRESRGIKIYENELAINPATNAHVDDERSVNYPLTPSVISHMMQNYNITKTTIQDILKRLEALENANKEV